MGRGSPCRSFSRDSVTLAMLLDGVSVSDLGMSGTLNESSTCGDCVESWDIPLPLDGLPNNWPIWNADAKAEECIGKAPKWRGEKNGDIFPNMLGGMEICEEPWVMESSSQGILGNMLNHGFWSEFSPPPIPFIIWSGVMGNNGNIGDGKKLLLFTVGPFSFFSKESMLKKLGFDSNEDDTDDFGCWWAGNGVDDGIDDDDDDGCWWAGDPRRRGDELAARGDGKNGEGAAGYGEIRGEACALLINGLTSLCLSEASDSELHISFNFPFNGFCRNRFVLLSELSLIALLHLEVVTGVMSPLTKGGVSPSLFLMSSYFTGFSLSTFTERNEFDTSFW